MSSSQRLLTIAGSDSGGGAGIQADLKTFAAHGAYGMSVVTAVTAQNTIEVRAVEAVSPALVASQLAAILEDIGVDGIKIGMLGSAEVIETVAAGLRPVADDIPIVLDPVMVAKSGARLLADDAAQVLAAALMPIATLVTPNLPEAEALTGLSAADAVRRVRIARKLSEYGPAVLIKDGHGSREEVEDLLFHEGLIERFSHSRQRSSNTHGTGCTLSSAVLARLARGETLSAAVEGGIDFVQGAMASSLRLGRGHGPLDHLFNLTSKDSS